MVSVVLETMEATADVNVPAVVLGVVLMFFHIIN